WVNITNHSGATYENARIKLMAGDVQILPEQNHRRGIGRDMMMMTEMSSAPQFEEQAFYEYHLYTLQRPSTLRENQIKQISLFPSASTPVKKEYRYEAYSGTKKVKVVLEFENRERVGLGIPLPRGKVRVYKEGPDGGLEFVGEDRIDHTPKDETIRISTGNAFDITGERTRMEYERQRGDNRMEEYVVKLRNHKEETVEVIVVESFHGDWELMDGTTPGWTKKSATTVEWVVRLRPDQEQEIRYRVMFQ
ncbi:MAG: hypothetical protein P9M15_06940, partial [Candidatus Electryoneaceae bacterium]|nr:hypothetical protein [Candidatus Electryoneaceae bacterium]